MFGIGIPKGRTLGMLAELGDRLKGYTKKENRHGFWGGEAA
jgi:hypothetical protein